MSVCKSSYYPEEETVRAGHVITQQGFPARQEGFFVAIRIVTTSNCVKGYMNFPEFGDFEYQGSMPKFLKALKQAGGARACLMIPGFTYSMG